MRMDCRKTVNYKVASLILKKDLVFPRNSIRELHSRYHLLQMPFSWIKGEEINAQALKAGCLYVFVTCLPSLSCYNVKNGFNFFIMVIYNSCKKIKCIFPVVTLKKIIYLFFHEGMNR